MFRRDKFWLRELERQNRAWEQERRALLDRIMQLSGQPFLPPDMPFSDGPLPDPDFEYPEVVNIE